MNTSGGCCGASDAVSANRCDADGKLHKRLTEPREEGALRKLPSTPAMQTQDCGTIAVEGDISIFTGTEARKQLGFTLTVPGTVIIRTAKLVNNPKKRGESAQKRDGTVKFGIQSPVKGEIPESMHNPQ